MPYFTDLLLGCDSQHPPNEDSVRYKLQPRVGKPWGLGRSQHMEGVAERARDITTVNPCI